MNIDSNTQHVYEPSFRLGLYECPIEDLTDGSWHRYFQRNLAGHRELPGNSVVVVGALTGGHPYLDQYLEQMFARLPDLVLLHKGDPGIGRWVSRWAKACQVKQQVLRPIHDAYTKYGEAFTRLNDVFLSYNPKLILNFFVEAWVNENLSTKAEMLGIPVVRIPEVPVRYLRDPHIYQHGPDFSVLPV